MKYVIFTLKTINKNGKSINDVTLKVVDKITEKDNVIFYSMDHDKVSDFYTCMKVTYQGLPNVVLNLA